MRHIKKLSEPRTVTDTRCAATGDLSRAVFDQLDKNAVRKQLAEEQGWLCAFCMERISEESVDDRGEHVMKIAHRIPIAVDSQQALNWQNLLGSCDGGQRRRGATQTCDYAQGSQAITVDPTKQESIDRLSYEHGSGGGLFITSKDPALLADVQRTLALNAGDLPKNRAQVRKAFQEKCRREGPKEVYGKQAWVAYFPTWLKKMTDSEGRLPPFLGVVETMLRS